jgi:hypothetical protein
MLLMSNPFKLPPTTRGSKIETPQKTKVRSGTLPSRITIKMNAFARHVAEGLSLADAYRAAFNAASMKAKTVRDDASRLAQHSGVRAAVNAYRAEIEARNRMEALEQEERIWQRLWELAEDEDVPPAVRVRALDLAARLCGMFKRPVDEVQLSLGAIEAELHQRVEALGLITGRSIR